MSFAIWSAPYDPAEKKDYSRDWTLELEATGDTLSAVNFTLPQVAIDAGLTVVVAVTAAANMKAVVWFDCNDAAACLAALGGQKIDIVHAVTTTSGRELKETLRLRIKEK